MNAERLHALAKALREEVSDAGTPTLLQQIVQGLNAMAQQPGQPGGPEQQVAQARDQLNERLARAPSNQFSPAWRETLNELGISDLLGDELRTRIEEIFTRNELTPTAAAAELSPIADSENGLDNALNQILQSFDFFRIGSEDLSPGEFEIGFLIPKPAVDDALGGLGAEFLKLKRILGPFLEATTGTREDPKLRSVSSSTIQVLLESHQATALMLAAATERVIAAYEKVMNIRLAYRQLKEADVGDKTLKDVAAEAESKMEAEIKALTEELLATVKVQQERQNELRKDFEHALNGIANRIDRGYTVEVRAGGLPAPAEEVDEEETEEEQALRRAVEEVLAKQERLRFTNTSGTRILQLPEGEDPEGEAGA